MHCTMYQAERGGLMTRKATHEFLRKGRGVRMSQGQRPRVYQRGAILLFNLHVVWYSVQNALPDFEADERHASSTLVRVLL